MIASACAIYTQVGGIYGAFLFGVGLWVILNLHFKLFTGTVGFIKSKEDIRNNISILIGNIIGACGSLALPINSTSIVADKLAIPLTAAFIRAIVCGVFIYMAVCCYKQRNHPLTIFGCVGGFILCGGEHCIADLCYLLAANSFTLDSLIFFIIVLIGNSIGALLVDRTISK